MKYDVIIIGGGHAGCEAALAAARMGCQVLVLTMSVDTIAHMPCNPAIGGLAKGHLVREIDALGGEMGQVADATGIQFRVLNRSKGPAVRGTRCQSDLYAYRSTMRQKIEHQNGLTLKQCTIEALVLDTHRDQKRRHQPRIIGVRSDEGMTYLAQTVIITTGTFLNGLIHMGQQRRQAGRMWEFAATALPQALGELNLMLGRLKTGTVPRLDQRSIDWERLEPQWGDDPLPRFSFWNVPSPLEQVSCAVTHTNRRTHQVIAANLQRSAMYSGAIQGVGPRYCPSIEDKVVKFAAKDRHQVFLEPTSLSSHEVYPNGLSTSMPLEVQLAFMRTIEGLEEVEITRPGYAVEYDFVLPMQLHPTLALKDVPNLFCAGQINGTSGYEEAAAQGLMAGINAALQVQQRPPFVLRRDQAYIGVLIDDLITKGTDEPYRMFTSRAEYRLMLREDNADRRLCELGKQLGLLPDEAYRRFREKCRAIERLHGLVRRARVPQPTANRAASNGAAPDEASSGRASSSLCSPATSSPVRRPRLPLVDLLKRPGVELNATLLLDHELRHESRQKPRHERNPHSRGAASPMESSVAAAESQLDQPRCGQPQLGQTRPDETQLAPDSAAKSAEERAEEITLTLDAFAPEVIAQVETDIKYAGYLARQAGQLRQLQRLEALSLPAELDYHQIRGLSHEVMQKMSEKRPATLGQASRISGITPAAIALLGVHLKQRAKQHAGHDETQGQR